MWPSLMILTEPFTQKTSNKSQIQTNKQKKQNSTKRKQDTIIECISFSSWQISEVQQSDLDVYMKPFSLRKKSLENKAQAL